LLQIGHYNKEYLEKCPNSFYLHPYTNLDITQNVDYSLIPVIGPEGGFSEKEIQFAINQGFQPISLGPSILRTETAVAVALSMVRDRGTNHAK
jgi:16S rRNA (uracil1498-N3)-methyltransferase